MDRCRVREEVELTGLVETSSDLTVTLTGTAIALACVACVIWTLSNDQAMPSEMVAQGASRVIDPAPASALVRPPDEVSPRTLLTLDRGENTAANPVVNAHLEIVGDGETTQTIDVSSMVRQLGFERRDSKERSTRSVGERPTDLRSPKPAPAVDSASGR